MTCLPGSSCRQCQCAKASRPAAALAIRHGRTLAAVDLAAAAAVCGGNPPTITVVVGQALRAGMTTTKAIEGFVAVLEAGEAALEAEGDAVLGRSRSLAASLSYGFAHAFTDAERTQLAVLHLFC